MDLSTYLLENYGYDEPILLKELYEELNINSNTLRQSLKRAVDQGEVNRYKYKNGIYFIPNPNSVLKKNTINLNKIISKQYLFRKGKRIGYVTGLAFANELQLTTQNPFKLEIVTQSETMIKRDVDYKIRQLTLRRPKVNEINEGNYKVLQILDLLNNFEQVSVKSIQFAMNKISNYLSDVTMNYDEFKDYLNRYSTKTQLKAMEIGMYHELTSK